MPNQTVKCKTFAYKFKDTRSTFCQINGFFETIVQLEKYLKMYGLRAKNCEYEIN